MYTSELLNKNHIEISSQTEFDIFYYTFLDASMDFYTNINTNFIELTHKNTYFVLCSGEKNGTRYCDLLAGTLGPKTIFLNSEKNSMVCKFNLFKKYLIDHKNIYQNSIFCKIDTDLVHYRCKQFHDLIRLKFENDRSLFIGNENKIGSDRYIRGGLNAVHFQSLTTCPDLPENHDPREFDLIFSQYLLRSKISKLHNVFLFTQSDRVNSSTFATHIRSQRLSKSKPNELSSLLSQLKTLNL